MKGWRKDGRPSGGKLKLEDRGADEEERKEEGFYEPYCMLWSRKEMGKMKGLGPCLVILAKQDREAALWSQLNFKVHLFH